MGSQLGVAVAALVMIGGFELFREFDQYRMLVFGAAMVVIMIWRPRGLVATRDALGVPRAQDDSGRSSPQARAENCRHDRRLSRAHGRAPDHALRRPARRQRSVVHRAARRDHGADRAERRRQDHGVQLHHRLLQADRRHAAARPSGRRASTCSNGCSTSASPSSRASRARSRTSACSPA